MKKSLPGVGLAALAALSLGVVVLAQAPQRTSASSTAAPSPQSVAPQQAILDQYCIRCHNHNVQTANLSIEDLSLSRVADNRTEWEKIVRKMRAGMMPPAKQDRPDHESCRSR